MRKSVRELALASAIWISGLTGCMEAGVEGAPAAGAESPRERPAGVHVAKLTMPDGTVQELTYRWEHGRAIHQGDIDLHLDSASLARAALRKGSGAGVADGGDKWSNGIMRYVTRNLSPTQSSDLAVAMQHWRDRTGLDFSFAGSNGYYEWEDIIIFEGVSENVCSAPIGYRTFGGTVRLGPNCDVSAMVHEIGHAFGLFHEQSRSDRSNHIWIDFGNIQDGKEHNFERYESCLTCPAGRDIGPYDYNSTMHYSAFAFAKDKSRPTIVAKNGATINPSFWLSRGDIHAIRSLYGNQHAPMPLFRDRNNALWHDLVWNLISGPVAFQQNGNRFAVLMPDKSLLVKEGVNGAWVNVTGSVKQFQISGNRIGALQENGNLFVKEGGLSATWVHLRGGVRKFQLEGTRVGALDGNGGLYVKEGGLSATWVSETGGASDFQLEGNRIGARLSDGTLLVKEGSLSAAWTNQIGGVKDFQLHGTRIGVHLADNQLWAKEGSLHASWAKLIGGVMDFKMDGNIIAYRDAGNNLFAKEGLHGTWHPMIGGVTEYRVWANTISCVLADGRLLSKRGTLGAWDEQWTNISSIEQVNWR